MTLDAWRAAGASFTHRGHDVFYRAHGAGSPTLLCIHGFPTASWDWHRVWDALCARFACVIAPDMLGFGFSAKPRPYAYSVADQADLHQALLAHLGVKRVHVLAHDYGDTVAQELLARHEERASFIESLCLLNGGLFPETHRATRMQRLLAGPIGPLLSKLTNERLFSRSLALVFGPRTKPTTSEMHDLWRLASTNDGTALTHDLLGYIEERRTHRARWVGALQKTKVPLRLIDGLVDPVSGAHMVARFRELVPNADVVELDVGHYPQLEDPEGVTRALLAFHDRNAPST